MSDSFHIFGRFTCFGCWRMETPNLLMCTALLSSVCCLVNTEHPCGRGEKRHRSENGVVNCLMCEHGTYMPDDEHYYERCLKCTQIENTDIEVLVIPCNRFHDAVILCKNGYYRHISQAFDERDRCERCKQCQFPEHEQGCQGYKDTACCDPAEETGATKAVDEVCKKVSVVCGPGQFLRVSSDECFPCPDGTLVSAHNHTYKECFKCEELSANKATHAIITRPCTRTAPTLFGCEDGYFRDPTQESTQKEVPCTPCRSCDRSIVDCGMFHDAVCVVQSPMTSTASSHITQPTVDDQASRHSANDTLTDVPEIYKVNSVLISGILLFFILSLMSCSMQAFSRAEAGFSRRKIFRDAFRLWLHDYLSISIALVFSVVLNALVCNGYFGAFTQDYIYLFTLLNSVVTAIFFCLYLFCRNNIRGCLMTCWNNFCSPTSRREMKFIVPVMYSKTVTDDNQN